VSGAWTASLHRDPAVFEEERRAILRRTWQLAGLAHELERPDDWIATEIGGRSVLIQRMEGELRAFHNVCVHRGTRLRLGARGNGPLRCGYHAWLYDARGVPVAIPKRATFGPLPEDLRLTTWAIAQRGSLVFVNGRPGASPLEESLGGAREALERLGRPDETRELVVGANWKLVVEGMLDSGATLVFPTLVLDAGAAAVHVVRPRSSGETRVVTHSFGHAPSLLEDAARAAERAQAGLGTLEATGSVPAGSAAVEGFRRSYDRFLGRA
jgi:nitrite reductase/ring-hydroxylating ferredoxin subunit